MHPAAVKTPAGAPLLDQKEFPPAKSLLKLAVVTAATSESLTEVDGVTKTVAAALVFDAVTQVVEVDPDPGDLALILDGEVALAVELNTSEPLEGSGATLLGAGVGDSVAGAW